MNLYGMAVSIRHARRACASLGIAALSLAICLGLALSSPARADSPASRPSVPFMAVFSGQVANAPGGRCPALTGTVTGSGVASMLGQFTNAQTHCLDPNGSDPLALTDGHFTYTNTNGDTIFGIYSGRLEPTPTSGTDNLYLIYGNYIVAGGTGTFAGAAGGGTVSGIVNIATGDYSASDIGALSPPAAKP